MATQQGMESSVEAAILSRLIRPERDDLSAEAATALLRFDFDQDDRDRLHELVTKNQDDALAATERRELEGYLRVSSFLDLMHAKASRSLKRKS